MNNTWKPIATKLLKAKHGMRIVGKELGSSWIQIFQTAGVCELGCPWAAMQFGICAKEANDLFTKRGA